MLQRHAHAPGVRAGRDAAAATARKCSHISRTSGIALRAPRIQQAAAAAAAQVAAPSQQQQEQGEQALPVPSFKASIDFKSIKADLEGAERNCRDRNSRADPRRAVAFYDEYVRLRLEADRLRAERNATSARMKGKLEAEERAQLIAAGQQLKEELAVVEEQVVAAENGMQAEGQRIPNTTHPSVPIGGEENATVLAWVGEQPKFESFQPLDHVRLAEALDMVDFDAAAEVSGQKFYYMRNAGALLEMALVNWALSRVTARGFTPITTPDLVKASVLEKCGFQPRGTNTQVYSVENSPLCLTGTAEVPLAGLYMDRVLQESDLPIKMAAYGHCFRTEAGASGAAGKGLFRVHQFSKVEMFVLCTPAQSDALHAELQVIGQEMYTELGLHFKVLDMPSGDLGATAHRKFDMEAWMPGLGRYGEISSASNCTDYQARRLNIRYKPQAPPKASPPAGAAEAEGQQGPSTAQEPAGASTSSSSSSGSSSNSSSSSEDAPAKGGGKKRGKGGKAGGGGAGVEGGGGGGSGARTEFVHTLNSTACAVPRIIVALLENGQQADGSVLVPAALQPFLGGMSVIRPPAPRK